MEVAPGIHVVDRTRGANPYLVKAEGGAVIIDTGYSGDWAKILEYAKGLGVEPGSITHIILTHADIDHTGGAAKLKGLTNAKVAIHEADAPRLSGEKKLKEVKGAVGVVFGALSPFMKFTPVKADLLLRDGDEVSGLKVIHTPGHTDGSISIYKEGVAIFVGDALRTDGAGRPSLPPASMTVDMERAKQSVKKISEFSYSILLPGHGAPILADASNVMVAFVDAGFRSRA